MLSLVSLVCAALLSAHEPPAESGSAGAPSLAPTLPRYVLDLTLEEFSVLHSAADHGVRTYAGHAAFKVDIFPTAQGLNWQVIIEEPKLLPVWTQWMAEKTAQLVAVTDVDQLGDGEKLAYRVTRSVNQKLKDAATKPYYDSTRLEGTSVKLPEGGAGLQLGEHGEVIRVGGRGAEAVAAAPGARMLVDGVVRQAGEIDSKGAFVRREGTLEVFVLSLCPFGKAAEKAILERMAQPAAGQQRPQTIEFRYLFIPTEDKTTFLGLHGEKEVQENLVQIVIRDQFPSLFSGYLLARSTSDEPWEQLAARAGLDATAVAFIGSEIVRNREALMAIEYSYWRDRVIPMESPTYLWEGRVIKELGNVPGMSGLSLTAGSCGG